MKDLVQLSEFIQDQVELGDLVLCTLVRKQGSSYRSVGAKKVVSMTGQSCGLLSGGCLEASIEKTARERFAELPLIESFSTLAIEDRLMGYQTGCQGVMEILFERIDKTDLELYLPFGAPPRAPGVEVSLKPATLGQRRWANPSSGSLEFFFDRWIEPVELVVIGCGVDADPFCSLAHHLGWRLKFFDYRKSWGDRPELADHDVRILPVDRIAEEIPLGSKTAVVLMTHNFEADLEILKGLNGKPIGYLGCLGPAQRYQQLKEDLRTFYQQSIASEWETKVAAPAGLFERCDSPHEISLSIVSQIQDRLIERKDLHTWTLVLAAGASSRFGSAKAVATFNGQTFIQRSLTTAQAFCGARVVTVLGCHAEQIAPHLESGRRVFNPLWPSGMSSSIKKGLEAIQELDPQVERVAILPVDMPLITAPHLRALSQLSAQTQLCAFTSHPEGATGVPAVIPRKYFPRAQELQGDSGFKSILRPNEMIFVEHQNAFVDIDQPSELVNLDGH